MTSDSPCNCVMADLSRVNCLTSTVAESFYVERSRAEPLLAIWNLKCWSLHKSLTTPSGEGIQMGQTWREHEFLSRCLEQQSEYLLPEA